MIVPAWPPAAGPVPARAKFFGEAAAAFELMSLWYSLPAEAQQALRLAIDNASAAAARAALETRKENLQ